MNTIIEDVAYLERWFFENEICLIVPYIEQYFDESSWRYQYWLMRKNLFFAKAIIDDDQMSDELKIHELIKELQYGKSKIVMIVGSRGSGKTATALWLAEEVKEKGGYRTIYYVGKPEYDEFYPNWIRFVKSLDDLPNNCYALVDEAAIKYSSRNAMRKENKDLTEELVILRHKGITMVLITQNIQLLEINVDRLADIIIYKQGTQYGIRKKKGESIPRVMKDKIRIMERLRPRSKDETMVEYLSGHKSIYRKFKNPLPTFWDDEKISKSFQHYKREPKPVKVKQYIKKGEDLFEE